jgi:hypothetical protein
MKMKNSVLSALLALGMSACVESSPALQIGGATAQGADCSLASSSAAGLLRGSLDLSFRGGGYPLVLAVTSNLVSTPIEIGDRPVGADEDLNTIYVTSLVLSYSSPTEGLTFTEGRASVPIYGTLEDDGNLLLNLLTSKVLTDLNGFVQGTGSAELLVTVQLKGSRVAGDEVESNEIVFPITVYRSGAGLEAAVCGPGKRFAASEDPCPQAGLNGVLPECEAIPTTP